MTQQSAVPSKSSTLKSLIFSALTNFIFGVIALGRCAFSAGLDA